jgi:hypothetical protein
MKTVAFVFGLFIAAVGAVGMLAPSALVWIAQQFGSPAAFYALAVVRMSFGLVLVSVASSSRVPTALRVLGYVIVTLGIATVLAGFIAVGEARSSIDWWLQQGSGVIRLTAIPVLALGGFIAYACAPAHKGSAVQART